MSKLNTENSAVATSSAENGDIEQQQQQQRIMKLVCDVNGCVIVPVAADASKVHGPKGAASSLPARLFAKPYNG